MGLAVLLLAYQSFLLLSLRADVEQLSRSHRAAQAELRTISGEVTRFRLEQGAEGKGANALLEMLAVYAPMLANARVTKPDYQAAKQQIDAVLRAFESLGADAWPKIRARLDELDPGRNFDQIKQLLRAAVRVDPEAGKALVHEILQGRSMPSVRLRWMAADLLLEIDRPLAQRALRKILTTESSRGAHPHRADGMLDPAAVAVTVTRYALSGDPELETTLLAVLVRTESDQMTLQETIEVLGHLRTDRAAKHIEKLYRHPPGAQQNPLFLNKCLDALVSIRGSEARSFLEEELARSSHDLVARHLQRLLASLDETPTKRQDEPK